MQTTSNVIDKNWKALIKPNKLDITSNDDKTIAKVVAEPLEKGFGQTIGNSLRRILLSSIQGAAVTAIQIDGVLHEFSSIKGVREDVTDIVLNVKNLAIKSSSSSSKKIILDIKGPKEVKAKDFTFNTMSVTSSLTPLIEVNSCNTPSIWIEVTAVPLIDDKSILLNELPRVNPYPFSSGSAVIFANALSSLNWTSSFAGLINDFQFFEFTSVCSIKLSFF